MNGSRQKILSFGICVCAFAQINTKRLAATSSNRLKFLIFYVVSVICALK